jgi:hypothetical protein
MVSSPFGAIGGPVANGAVGRQGFHLAHRTFKGKRRPKAFGKIAPADGGSP